MKRILSTVLAIVSLLSLVSCRNDEESVYSYKEYSSLARLADGIMDSQLYCGIELVGMNTSQYYIEITQELQSTAFQILTESGARFEAGMLDDGSRDLVGDAIVIQLWDKDERLSPAGDQICFCAIFALGPNDPIAPNATFLTVNNEAYENDGYVYPADVYSQLFKLFSDNKKEIYASIKGEYIRIQPSQAEIYPRLGDILECQDVLVSGRYTYDDNSPYSGWQVETYDITTGTKRYSYDNRSANASPIYRMGNWDPTSGYDYRLVLTDGVLYKNSADVSKEKFVPLPSSVKPLDMDVTSLRWSYDTDESHIVWIQDNGVNLCEIDGTNERHILKNSELPALFPDSEGYNGTLFYIAPHFICGGQKVVAAVYSHSQEQDIGVVVYDIDTGAVTSTHAYFPPCSAQYPVIDRFVVSRSMGSRDQILDAQAGEVKDLPQMRLSQSYDYKTFIVMDYQSLEPRNAPAYVCDIENPKDRSRLLLSAGSPEAWLNLAKVTAHYAVFDVMDYDGSWLAVAKYR